MASTSALPDTSPLMTASSSAGTSHSFHKNNNNRNNNNHKTSAVMKNKRSSKHKGLANEPRNPLQAMFKRKSGYSDDGRIVKKRFLEEDAEFELSVENSTLECKLEDLYQDLIDEITPALIAQSEVEDVNGETENASNELYDGTAVSDGSTVTIDHGMSEDNGAVLEGEFSGFWFFCLWIYAIEDGTVGSEGLGAGLAMDINVEDTEEEVDVEEDEDIDVDVSDDEDIDVQHN
ncbi:hypothetical protein HDU76_008644 [Blyttiomyces sp. JEL0837]|nr:hypothetical protein HDU76_008644 [Blyttiomyces sp. JEL0837]